MDMFTSTSLVRWNGSDVRTEVDELVAEEPLEIRVGGRAISVTMRTPDHDAELAAGFLLSEGVVRRRQDIRSIHSCARANNLVNVVLDPLVPVGFEKLTRHVFASSSCGLCGIPELQLAEGNLLLTTLRSHDQFNTTIYSENDRYRGISNGRRVIFLNTDDMARLDLQKDQWVDITSHFELETRRAERFKVVPYNIPAGCAAAYYPETNVLVPIRDTTDGSNQPASKSIVISIEPTNTGRRVSHPVG